MTFSAMSQPTESPMKEAAINTSVYATASESLPIGEQESVYERIVAALSDSERDRLKRGLHARGREVIDRSGVSIGTAVAVMVDRETARPQWLAIQLTDTRRHAVVGVPIMGLWPVGQRVSVMFAASVVFTAEEFDPGYLPASVERALCQHYFCQPTRGANTHYGEERATSSRAFWAEGVGGKIGWLPAPRRIW